MNSIVRAHFDHLIWPTWNVNSLPWLALPSPGESLHRSRDLIFVVAVLAPYRNQTLLAFAYLVADPFFDEGSRVFSWSFVSSGAGILRTEPWGRTPGKPSRWAI
jgi:hypothetical protein